MHNYTPLVISENDKNKQLALLPMKTPIYWKKYVNKSTNAEGHLKNIKKQARRLFRPRSIHLCHQKPIPARETVTLRKGSTVHVYVDVGYKENTPLRAGNRDQEEGRSFHKGSQ